MRLKTGGFALVEILIAVGILAAVGIMVQSTFSVLTGSLEEARERTEISRSAENLMWFISSEVNNAVSAGGLEFSYNGEGGSREIHFHSTVAYPGAGQRDFFSVMYSVKEKELWKGVNGDYFKLGDGLDNFEVRFYGGGEWHDEWVPEDYGAAPRALEISFEMSGEKFRKIAAVQSDPASPGESRGRRIEL